MVDIAQLVSASDCGSEGRGFESHYPPHKKKPHPFGWGSFYGIMGFERPLRKHAGGMFLGRGRIPRFPGAVLWTVNGNRNVIENVKSLLLPK